MKIRILLVTVLLALSNSSLAGTITKAMSGLDLCSGIVAFRGLAFFCYNHPIYGKEVHYSDGSEFGTRLLKDIDSGPGSSTPLGFFEFQGKLYFFAENTLAGYSLWRTDGTNQGTKLIQRLVSSQSIPRNASLKKIAEIDGTIFVHIGPHLVRTDGTANGTSKIAIEVGRNQIFFANEYGIYAANSGRGIYRISKNGKISQVIKFQTARPLLTKFSSENLTALVIYPDTHPDESNPRIEIWLSDGTRSGTRFFRYSDEIWLLGTINKRLFYLDIESKDLRYLSENRSEITIKNLPTADAVAQSDERGRLRLVSNDHQTFISDGTNNGTLLIPIDFFNGGSNNGFGDLVIGKCIDQDKICASNGVGATQAISSASRFVWSGSERGQSSIGLYLHDTDNQLWLTDGTRDRTRVIYHHASPNIGIFIHGVEGQRLYYSAQDANKNILWQSNGTTAGTYPLKLKYQNPSIDEERNRVLVTSFLQLVLLDD